MADLPGIYIWSQGRDLYNIVKSVTFDLRFELYPELECILSKHLPDFIHLLEIPARKEQDRDTLKKSQTQLIRLQGETSEEVNLTQGFIDEVLLISDLFKINEMAAANLVITGESHMSFFHGLTRGLTSVLMFYSIRLDVVNSLKFILQARQGQTWTCEMDEANLSLLTEYADNLINLGILDKILEQLEKLDVEAEMQWLHDNKAIGTKKHRQQIEEKLTELKQSLSDCVLCICAQTFISKDQVVSIINYIIKIDATRASKPAPVEVAKPDITILIAVLYSIQVKVSDMFTPALIMEKLPMFRNPSYITSINTALTAAVQTSMSTVDPTATTTTATGSYNLLSATAFGWAVTLRIASKIANDGRIEYDIDEQLLDYSLQLGALRCLIHMAKESTMFKTEEFYLLRIHELISQFIINMPLKIKELRSLSIERAKIIDVNMKQGGGISECTLPTDLEDFYDLIYEMYKQDDNDLELANEYWYTEDIDEPNNDLMVLAKFVTESSEQLTPDSYTSYLRMLSSLCGTVVSSSKCYDMLRYNGTLQTGSSASIVSWNHIFRSLMQYNRELSSHKEISRYTSTDVHHQHHRYRMLNTQEVAGLDACLQLVEKICDVNELARTAFKDCADYGAVASILGLIQCSVPPTLKSRLLYVLRSLSRGGATINDTEGDHALWKAINDTQLVVQDVNVCGMKREIVEIETSNKDYPMSLAFLSYVYSLCTQNSVVSQRFIDSECFIPYITLIRNEIFVKYSSRLYTSVKQKWDICLLCLRIFHRLITLYNPTDIPPNAPCDYFDRATSAGQTLLVHLMNDSPMLQTILHTLDEITQNFDQYQHFIGKKEMLDCALVCLQIINLAQEKIATLFDHCKNGDVTLKMKDIEYLLLVNRYRNVTYLEKQNRCSSAVREVSHIINISKFICYSDWLIEHSCVAVEILVKLNLSLSGRGQLVQIYTGNPFISCEILHGFVHCLQSDEEALVKTGIQSAILDLIINSVNEPAPNIAHFLCGFNLNDISSSKIEHPGVDGTERNCLHSIIELLNKGTNDGRPVVAYQNPRLAELAMHVISSLCTSPDTAVPTLRYLRNGYDFLFKQLNFYPLDDEYNDKDGDEFIIRRLDQQSWLCTSTGIEYHLSSGNTGFSYGTLRDNKRIVSLLFDEIDDQDEKGDGNYYSKDETCYSLTIDKCMKTGRRKILRFLDIISFSIKESVTLEDINLKYLPRQHCELMINECLHTNKDGLSVCNVKLLHSNMTKELSKQVDWSASKINDFKEEIEKLCMFKVTQNTEDRYLSSRLRALSSWKQLLEVIIIGDGSSQYASEADLESETLERKNLLLQLMHELLKKATIPDFDSQFTSYVAKVLLTLTDCLNNLLDFNNHSTGPLIESSTFKMIFKNLMKFMRESYQVAQGVRFSLYSILSLLMKMSKLPDYLLSENELSNAGMLNTVPEDTFIKLEEYRNLRSVTSEMVRSNSEMLMEILCNDESKKSHTFLMVSMSVLEAMVSVDGNRCLIVELLRDNGYVRSKLAWALNDPENMRKNLEEQGCFYNSIVSLLISLAVNSTSGAVLVIESKCLLAMKMNTILSSRPDINNMSAQDYYNEMTFYRNYILFPTMQLCKALVATLASNSQTARIQIIDLLSTHVEVFVSILSAPNLSLQSENNFIKEISLLTSVISLTCINPDEISLTEDRTDQESVSRMYRLHRAMLSLLTRSNILVVDNEMLQADSLVVQEKRAFVDEIYENIAHYTRSYIRTTPTSNSHRVLFDASLNDAIQTTSYYNSNDNSNHKRQSLAVIAVLLMNAVVRAESLQTLMGSRKALLKSQDNMSFDAVVKLLLHVENSQQMNGNQRMFLALNQLYKFTLITRKQLTSQIYIIENLLFVMWHHLNCYYMQSAQADVLSTRPSHFMPNTPGYQVDQSATVRMKYTKLKAETKALYGDEEIFHRISSITRIADDENTFTEIMIRRMKRLINLC